MARPRKQTVDYFPHVVVSGKTMFVLEAQFGNDGYAFWFKLLELLGSTDGHVYDCRNPADWQFLLAKTRVDEDKAHKILELLSNLHAIDVELWENNVIWCQNFVDNITDAYKNRRAKPPVKPDVSSFYSKKPVREGVSTDRNYQDSEVTGVSTAGNPQTKLNETKLNETKSNNNIQPEKSMLPTDEKFGELCKFYESNIGPLTDHIGKVLNQISEDHSTELALYAFQKSVEANAGNKLKYTEAVLKGWKSQKLETVEAVTMHESKRQHAQKRTENAPDWLQTGNPSKDTNEPTMSDEEIEIVRQKLLQEFAAK